MVKSQEFNSIEQEEETFNIAGGFVALKILQPLARCDTYERIATFGTDEITDMISENMKIKNRIDALKRFRFELINLIENAEFKIKKEDLNKWNSFKEKIKLFDNIVEKVYYETFNDKTKKNELAINESSFRIALKLLCDISSEINTPLNNAGLIFRQLDTLNLDSIIDKFSTSG